MTLDIISIGEPLIEFNQTGGVNSMRYLQGFGGDSSNFIIAAARQGARTGYLTALGDDAYGRMFLDLWRTDGIDASAVKIDRTAPTAVYFVTHDKTGHAFHFYRTGSAASHLTPADIDRDYVASAKVLHCSGISLAISTSACDACYSAVEIAKAAGQRVSFDTNLRLKLWPKDRARAVITDMMSLCDICLPSYDDLAALTEIIDEDALVDFALACGAPIVALKCGERGAIVASPDARHRIDPHPVTAVDATGAGDTFGGAFVARLLAGDDLPTAGRYAAVAAALSTTGFGAVAPIPTADQVRSALAQHPQGDTGR
jgi:2-dehydro-3-deoxygluconokinase